MIETFADRDTLADAAANLIAEHLTAGGLFVATGGSTPGPVYDRLSQCDLPWDQVRVTLTDDRWVAPWRDESNERLVTERLLVGRATCARARLTSLWWEGVSIDADAQVAESRIVLALPAAVTLMGMGPDGHVASLFPGAPEPPGERLVIPVAMSGLPPFVPRITLTRRALLQTGLIVLIVTGDDKRQILQRIAADPAYDPPAAAFLRQTAVPVRTLWAA